jgi:hypothetical protein
MRCEVVVERATVDEATFRSGSESRASLTALQRLTTQARIDELWEECYVEEHDEE